MPPCQVFRAMSKNYVKVALTVTLKEAIKSMKDGQQNCVLVANGEDFLEGILTYGDIKRCLSKQSSDNAKGDSIASDVCNCCLTLSSRSLSLLCLSISLLMTCK